MLLYRNEQIMFAIKCEQKNCRHTSEHTGLWATRRLVHQAPGEACCNSILRKQETYMTTQLFRMLVFCGGGGKEGGAKRGIL